MKTCLWADRTYASFFRKSLSLICFSMTALVAIFSATPALSVDHFSWGTAPTSVEIGKPFVMTVEARSFDGLVETDFNSAVTISAATRANSPGLLISEVGVIGSGFVELCNVGDSTLSVGAWTLTLYDATTWPAPRSVFTFPAGTVCLPRSVFQVRGGGASPGGFPSFSLGVNLIWSTFPSDSPKAVLLRDVSGRIADYFCAGTAYPVLVNDPVLISEREWFGLPAGPVQSMFLSYQRGGVLDHNNAADWTQASFTAGRLNPTLRFPFRGPLQVIPAQPQVVTLTNGAWQGFVTISQSGNNFWLRADDGAGHSGDSANFVVLDGPPLIVQLPGTGNEGSAGFLGNGTVSITNALPTNLVVSITVDLPGEIQAPASVLLTAGQTNAVFALTNLDDNVIDGPRVVNVTVSAPGFSSGTGSLTNEDNESVLITVSVPPSVREGDGLLIGKGKVAINLPAGLDLPLQLSSSNTNELQVPENVYVPAGQTSALFNITVIDDAYVDGPQIVTIRASLGSASANANTVVEDNESTNLNLQVFGFVEEGRGTVSEAIILSLGGKAKSNVVARFTSDNPARLQVPAEVTIPAGQSRVVTSYFVADDADTNGTAVIYVTASANGFGPDPMGGVSIYDNDPFRFIFSPNPTAQSSDRPFPLTVSAQTIDGHVPSTYAGQAVLRAIGHAGAVPISPSNITFTAGTWNGTVTIHGESRATVISVDDGMGHIGNSAPFDISLVSTSSLPVSDLVFDSQRGQIVAGVLASGGTNSNSLVGIDPATGAIVWKVALGTEPSRLALSQDRTFVYVGGNTTGGVARVNLNTRAVALRFPLGSDVNFGPFFVEDMQVMPGNPRTIVVSRKVAFGAYNQGLTVYDDQVQRPAGVGPGSFAFGYYVDFFGYSNRLYSASPDGITIIAVTPSGLVPVSSRAGGPYATDFEYEGDLLYGTSGTVFSRENLNVVGSFAASGWVRPDAASDRIAFLSENRLTVFNQNSFARIGTLNLPMNSANPNRLIRCGSNRYAFQADDNRLVILRTDMIPLPASTDLSITQNTLTITPTVESNVTYVLLVSNAGPAAATSTRVIDELPAGSTFVSAIPSLGSCSQTNGMLTCDLGLLDPQSSASITVTILSKRPGDMVNVARVIGGALNPGNDVTAVTNVATFGPTLPALTEMAFNAAELVYDSQSNRLWMSVFYNAGTTNVLTSLRMSSGLMESLFPLGTEPQKMVISDNGQYVYLGVHPGLADVYRFNTRTRAKDQQFSVAGGVVDMEVVPGDPASVLVSRGGPQYDLAVYSNGIQTKRSISGPAIRFLEFSDSPLRFFGIDGNYGSTFFGRFDVTSTNLQLVDGVVNLFARTPNIKFANGKLFGTDGVVVDPVGLTRVSMLPAGGLVQSDPASGQVFYLGQDATTSVWILTAFDSGTFETLWAKQMPEIVGAVSGFAQCQSGILAISTVTGQLFIVNTALLPHVTSADLEVWFQPAASSGPANLAFTFTGFVRNNGPAPAINVVVTNTVSDGTVLLSEVLSQGGFTNDGGKLICRFGNLSSGSAASFTISAMRTNAGILLVSATGTSDVADPVSTNNSGSFTAPIEVPASADLALWDNFTVGPGGSFNYTVIVSNAGPDSAASVVLTDVYPTQGTILGVNSSQGSASTNDGYISADLGSIAPEAIATISFQLQPAASATLLNRGQAFSTITPDPIAANNNFVSMATPAGVSLLTQIQLGSADFAYDAVHGLLYLSVPSTGGPLSNSVVGIEPDSGTVIQQIHLTEPVGKLAISDGGEYIYAALTQTGAVLRISTTSGVTEARIQLPDDPTYGKRVAFDLAPIPGYSQSIAVSSRWIALGYDPGIEIFDGTNRRPNGILVNYGASYYYLGFPTTPDRLFANGYGGFNTLSVDDLGVTSSGSPVTTLAGSDFVLDHGLAYFDSGHVFNPDTQVVLGIFPVGVDFVAPDIASNRVYFLAQNGNGIITIKAFDPGTFSEVWSLSFPAGTGWERGFLKLRPGEFAIRTDDRILILKTPPLEVPLADLSLTASGSPNPVTVGGTIAYGLTVRNNGPWRSTNVVVSDLLPVGVSFVSATASQGSCTLSNQTVLCSIGSLANGASASARITLAAMAPGLLSNQFAVSHELPDANSANNSVSVSTTVTSTPTISIANTAVAEGSNRSPVTFTVTLSGASTLPVSARYSTLDGTALAGVDYDVTSGTVVFPPGSTSTTIRLSPGIYGNTVVESNRVFFMSLSNATNGVLGSTPATATIIDDDFYNISIQNTNVVEGNSGVTNATFVVQLAPTAPNGVTVFYETVDGTANAGSDYVPRAGTLRFSPGVTAIPISVPILGDTRNEIDETFFVLLSGNGGVLLKVNEATGRIINDDAEPVLALVGINQVGNAWHLHFSSAAGKSYRLQRSDSLTPSSWNTVVDQIAGTGELIEVADPTALTQQSFYRVQLLP